MNTDLAREILVKLCGTEGVTDVKFEDLTRSVGEILSDTGGFIAGPCF